MHWAAKWALARRSARIRVTPDREGDDAGGPDGPGARQGGGRMQDGQDQRGIRVAGDAARTALGRDIDALYAGAGPDGPGGIVAVYAGDELVHTGAYGLANVEHGVPWTATTRYPVASITKTFVADLVLKLADAGQLKLTDPVARFYPEIGPLGADVTIEHLLTMSAGYRHDEVIAGWFGADDRTNAYLVELIARQQARQHPLGMAQNYCCGGYRVLARVIEAATGLTFEAALRLYTFDPLGMAASSADPRWSRIERGRASLYEPAAPDGWCRVHEVGESSGDGAIVSTLDDLTRFVAYLRRDRDGTSPLARLAAGAPRLGGEPGYYGYGLAVEALDGRRSWGHGGSTNCGFYVLPDDDLTVIMLNNNYALRAFRMIRRVARLAAGRATPAPTEDWVKAAGFYGCRSRGFLLELLVDDGQPAVRILGERPVAVEPTAQGFRLAEQPGRLTARWIAGKGEAPQLEVVEMGSEAIVCERFDLVAGPGNGLEALQGRYWSDEYGGHVEVGLVGDGLELRLGVGAARRHRRRLIELAPGFFHSDGTSVRLQPDGSRLLLSHGRARDVAFRRW